MLGVSEDIVQTSKQTNLGITLKNSLERSRNASPHLVSKEKNQGEQFKAENVKTLESHKLSMRLFFVWITFPSPLGV